jgi:hypothetical protein
MGRNVKFQFDRRGLEKAVQAAARKAVEDKAEEMERTLDAVFRSHAGKPVDQVMPRLRAAARSAGWKFTAADLRVYADAISQGKRIAVRTR